MASYKKILFTVIALISLSVKSNGQETLDKIIAVIGKNRIILQSDMELQLLQMKEQKVMVTDSIKCSILQQMILQKMFAEQADRDSLIVSDDEVENKLENRINYFRQNAGVRDILAIDKERSAKCQEASVMFAPIGVFSREPGPETHTCYTKDAGQAAMFGQMVKDPNPAIALTVLMSDDKSEELYNRQFVLAPNSRKLGIGASENNTVVTITPSKVTDQLLSNFLSTANEARNNLGKRKSLAIKST